VSLHPACLAAAETALNDANCPRDPEHGYFGRAEILARCLALGADGVVRVVDERGEPRLRPNRHGTGQMEPVTIAELLEDLIYWGSPGFGWKPGQHRNNRGHIPAHLRPHAQVA
jgi:hypothetical protein